MPDASIQPKPRRRCASWLRRLPLLISLALVAGYFGGLLLSTQLLEVKGAAGPADVIIVLGGETGTRTTRAAELYQAGRAPWVLITGAGDTESYSADLLRHGVPASALILEDRSSSTAENARFTVPLLRERGLTNVILVTSWYHSRRTLACFEHYAPDLKFSSTPTRRESTGWWPNPYERQRILMEYVKLFGYIFRHGVWPF
jgi:uncharacterized SAM-binding protein YcdF (DUF218 family)